MRLTLLYPTNESMANKILVAITGASGAIYPKLLLDKLLQIPGQWEELSVVMSTNAKQIWETELGDTSYANLPVRFFDKNDFNAPFKKLFPKKVLRWRILRTSF